MNIQQLEYLIAVDKYKHFGKAAKSCFITQPTLSAMVHKLEEELDLRIFDRTSHPIRTTDVGTEIVKQAQSIIDAVNELRNKANQLNNVLGGKINLGIIPTVSSYLLPTAIFDFLNENTKVEMAVKEMTTENIIKSLKSGELDAGIIATPYDSAKEFYHEFLFNEELMLYSSDPKHKQESYIVPEEIDIADVWLLEEGNCLRTQFENICHLKENSMKPRNLEFVAGNVNTLVQMVDRIGGITILPELAVEQLQKNQLENVQHFRPPFPYREMSMIYYKPTYKQKIIDQFVAHIKTALTQKLNFSDDTRQFVPIKPQ